MLSELLFLSFTPRDEGDRSGFIRFGWCFFFFLQRLAWLPRLFTPPKAQANLRAMPLCACTVQPLSSPCWHAHLMYVHEGAALYTHGLAVVA
jgi:hypothetical protein